MALPPLHRIDGAAVFVHRADSFWDWPRISKEAEESDEPHPVARYLAGLTRWNFDLVEKYGKPDESPTKFYLKKLSTEDYGRALDMASSSSESAAKRFAFMRGCALVEGIKGLADYDLGGRPVMTLQELKRFEKHVHPDILFDVGDAVVKLLQALSYEEGKA